MPHQNRRLRIAALVVILCAVVVVILVRADGQATFTIDCAKKRQVIEGFGATATGTWIPEVVDLYAKPEFAQRIGDDLGVSIIRLALPPAIQPNEDLDAARLDLAAFDLSKFNPPAGFIKNIRRAHPDLKVMLTVWSPPAWMKDTHSSVNGGRLRADRREHFGKFCAAACLGFERDYGVPVHALSIQNEPAFAQKYDSCVYTPREMADTAKAVRAAFTRWNVKTKIMAPEDVADPRRYPTFLKPFGEDPEALAALDIMNIHGQPALSTAEAAGPWESLRDELAPLKKPMWMTETSGEEPVWLGAEGRGGLSLAQSIHNAVAFGGCAAWVYWAITDPTPSEFALMGLSSPTPKYAALKQYSKFIKPGAVRIEVAPTSRTILVSAYLDETQLTIVIINMDKTDTPMTALLSSLPGEIKTFAISRSSATEGCVPLEATKVRDGHVGLMLKAESVTTLTGAILKQETQTVTPK